MRRLALCAHLRVSPSQRQRQRRLSERVTFTFTSNAPNDFFSEFVGARSLLRAHTFNRHDYGARTQS